MLRDMPPAPARPFRVPGRLTPLVGREADVQAVLLLLQGGATRLVTIVGMGGVGKTALALEAACRLQEQRAHGALLVPLAQLGSVDELLPALAHALDVQLPPNGDLQQAVLDHLASRELLLVLDSFEHLLGEALLVRELLAAAPRLQVLVTSREKLNLEAETVFPLSGLSLAPARQDTLTLPDAAALFVQRARHLVPAFTLDQANAPAVAELCRMVDGNPLAILLAASWVEHFSPAEICEQARRSLDFLSHAYRDADPRHSSLRAVFESSFRRLGAAEQEVLRRLAVFRGGFDLPAARAVAAAGLPTLVALVDKSMLSRLAESGRYELHGLVQQYAREQLELAGELEPALAAHAAYYCAFVEATGARLLHGDQTAGLDALQADLDNVRQAWSRVVEQRDLASARRMLPGLYAFSDMRSRYYEGEAMFRQGAEGLAPLAGEPPGGAWALALLSWFDMRMYFEPLESYELITAQAQGCSEHCRAAVDAQGAAAGLNLLGAIAQHQRDYAGAIRYCQEAMQVYPDLDGAYWVTMRIGLCHQAAGQYEEALRMFEGCLERGRLTGEVVKTGWSLQNIADTFTLLGHMEHAEEYLEQALESFKRVGTPIGELWSLYSLAQVRSAQGQEARALEAAHAALGLANRLHSTSWIPKADELLRRLEHRAAPAAGPGAQPQPEPLSQRELEVLELLKSELSGPEIARKLVVSLNTVRFHTKHIYHKLGAGNRLEAIRRARELGL